MFLERFFVAVFQVFSCYIFWSRARRSELSAIVLHFPRYSRFVRRSFLDEIISLYFLPVCFISYTFFAVLVILVLVTWMFSLSALAFFLSKPILQYLINRTKIKLVWLVTWTVWNEIVILIWVVAIRFYCTICRLCSSKNNVFLLWLYNCTSWNAVIMYKNCFGAI